MIHQPLGGAQGQATDIKIASDRIISLRKRLNKCLAKNTGQSLKKIEKDTERDNYLDAREAVDYGIVDKIILERGKVSSISSFIFSFSFLFVLFFLVAQLILLSF